MKYFSYVWLLPTYLLSLVVFILAIRAFLTAAHLALLPLYTCFSLLLPPRYRRSGIKTWYANALRRGGFALVVPSPATTYNYLSLPPSLGCPFSRISGLRATCVTARTRGAASTACS